MKISTIWKESWVRYKRNVMKIRQNGAKMKKLCPEKESYRTEFQSWEHRGTAWKIEFQRLEFRGAIQRPKTRF